MTSHFGTHAWVVILTLAVAFVLFIWNRWRYDLVSLATLLFLTVAGVIPVPIAFLGFGHPAVVTVVAVLIVSRGLQNSGVLDYLSAQIAKPAYGITVQLSLLCVVTAALSAFINNIGALAVMMPLTLQAARQQNRSPSLYLMPIAFSSLLGGLTTLIGTPPNIIISSFRSEIQAQDFFLFDYSFVGLPIALIGIFFIASVGWRLIPVRKKAEEGEGRFDVGDYTTEVLIPDESEVVGQTFADLQKLVNNELILVVRANRSGRRASRNKREKLKAGDALVVEGPTDAIKSLLDQTDLEIASNSQLEAELAESETHLIGEAVVLPGSSLVGRMPRAQTLRRRFAVALLAVARQGEKLRSRFSKMRLKTGDILLLRGESEDVDEMMRETGCLPLAPREIQVGLSTKSLRALAIFLLGIALVLFQLLPPQISFTIAAVLMVANGIVPVRSVYQHIDWSIVILLGALLPVGHALESSGAAQGIVDSLLGLGNHVGPASALGVLLVAVMFLSDLVNNAAAAALAAPVAYRLANALEVSPDPFLMAVAIGASCAFLTPIGHQSNTLVMGPGGYRFSDYWKLGLPLEILIVAVSIPGLLYFWPLNPAGS